MLKTSKTLYVGIEAHYEYYAYEFIDSKFVEIDIPGEDISIVEQLSFALNYIDDEEDVDGVFALYNKLSKNTTNYDNIIYCKYGEYGYIDLTQFKESER